MSGDNTLISVKCKMCSGTIAAKVGTSIPQCMFCGRPATDLIEIEMGDQIELPEQAVDFVLDDQAVRDEFVGFAKSSFFYPSDLRRAQIHLKPLHLPAWAWSGVAETHWTGLVSASTLSGKRPVGGQQVIEFTQILIPSSNALTFGELAALSPYDETGLRPWVMGETDTPFEVPQVTRAASRTAAAIEMEQRHSHRIQSEEGTVSIHVSSITKEMDGKPVLLPVFIGTYQYGEKAYRILVNGQTGVLVGDAPISIAKVLGLIGAVLALLGGFAVFAYLMTAL